MPIILRTIGRERIRQTKRVNKELPSAFLNFLKSEGVHAKITDWKKLHYEGQTYEGRKANKKYIITQIYGLALPTCIQFDLVSQQDPHEMLTFYGRKLLQVLDGEHVSKLSQSNTAFDMFGRIAIQRDACLWGILPVLKEMGTEADVDHLISFLLGKGVRINVSTKAVQRRAREKVISDLRAKGMVRNSSDIRRLSSWIESKSKEEINRAVTGSQKAIVRNILSIFSSLGLVGRKHCGNITRYYANQDEIQRLIDRAFWSESVENSRFFGSLKCAFQDIAASPAEPVPIPLLRDAVCLAVDVPWAVFDRKILDIGYNWKGHRISLSRAIFSKKWGIFIGRTNYYYISVREEGK